MDLDDVTTLDRRIHRLGSRFLFHPTVLAACSAQGVDDPVLAYAGGRGGVLGDVAAEQVASAFGFFPSEVVHDAWGRLRAEHRPGAVASAYADGVAAAGREDLVDAEAAATVAELGATVSGAVVPMGYALFTGWRALPRPDDDAGAAALELMTLRELRGDIHLQEIAAAGLHPHEAEIVSRGVDGVGLHGWQPPHPDPGPVAAAVGAAVRRTDERMARCYDVALGARSADLASAVQALDAIVDP